MGVQNTSSLGSQRCCCSAAAGAERGGGGPNGGGGTSGGRPNLEAVPPDPASMLELRNVMEVMHVVVLLVKLS